MLSPRYRLLLILLACIFPLAMVQAADPPAPPPFTEGKDYVLLSNPSPPATPGKVEVIEFFSYTCPHCYNLEPAAREWLKRKPDQVAFVRIAVSFSANWEPSARAYYAAEALGVLDKIHPRLFEAIHQNPRMNLDELAAFFATQGVDRTNSAKPTNLSIPRPSCGAAISWRNATRLMACRPSSSMANMTCARRACLRRWIS